MWRLLLKVTMIFRPRATKNILKVVCLLAAFAICLTILHLKLKAVHSSKSQRGRALGSTTKVEANEVPPSQGLRSEIYPTQREGGAGTLSAPQSTGQKYSKYPNDKNGQNINQRVLGSTKSVEANEMPLEERHIVPPSSSQGLRSEIYSTQRGGVGTVSVPQSTGQKYSKYPNDKNRENITLDDIFITIKTSGKFHQKRLGVILRTWWNYAKNQFSPFFDFRRNSSQWKIWVSGPKVKREETEKILEKLQNASETRVVLLWHTPSWVSVPKKLQYSKCGRCKFTVDKSLINDTSTGAVLFYFSGIRKTNMPSQTQRNQDQLHIYWTIEPPANIRVGGRSLGSTYQFNATMSYKRTSDFRTNYDTGFTNGVRKMNISETELLKMKKRNGVALVSNCGAGSKMATGAKSRIKILKKIQNLGFPLDGFGGCFSSNQTLKRGDKNYLDIMRQYRFVFSFENSYHCQDYITEKVYRNAFHSLAVPVVWGAKKEDYEFALPKGSFIYVEDFSSLESLIQYLQFLTQNETAYLEYFKWHREEPLIIDEPIGGPVSGFCQICRVIHGINVDDRHNPNYDPFNPPRPLFTDGIATRNAPSVDSFVFENENKECIELDVSNWKFYKDWKLDE